MSTSSGRSDGSESRSRVVVTGCGNGIGRAIALGLADAGYFVHGLDIDQTAARALDHELAHSGRVEVGDASDPGTLHQLARADYEDPPLAGWVNNAAVAYGGTLDDVRETEVRRVFEVNLLGYFWGCSAAVQEFLRLNRAGVIVNVSSIHGSHAYAGWAAYDTAKGGVDALTRYAAVEYGRFGIRVNAVAPGTISTPMLHEAIARNPESHSSRAVAGAQPLGRIGLPEEVASLVRFLVSPEASFVTGQIVGVDGGASAWCWPQNEDPGADLRVKRTDESASPGPRKQKRDSHQGAIPRAGNAPGLSGLKSRESGSSNQFGV
jgi:NAD(P)-dependent dehydrogenase (short-subunit alcohol dehydrogenase family)